MIPRSGHVMTDTADPPITCGHEEARYGTIEYRVMNVPQPTTRTQRFDRSPFISRMLFLMEPRATASRFPSADQAKSQIS